MTNENGIEPGRVGVNENRAALILPQNARQSATDIPLRQDDDFSARALGYIDEIGRIAGNGNRCRDAPARQVAQGSRQKAMVKECGVRLPYLTG